MTGASAILRRMGGSVALVIALALFYWSVRLAWADWVSKDRTRESIQAAILMVPANWTYYRDWAEFVPGDALPALRQSIKMNPLNPGLRVELAEAAEKVGGFQEAEENLKQAKRLDKTATPLKLLAEFYFRRRKAEQFWPVMRQALEIASSVPQELFADCWELSSDSNFILRNAISDRPEVLTDYLYFLMEQNHVNAAPPVAVKLMTRAPEDVVALRKVFLRYCTQMTEHNRVEEAVTAWNWLSKEKMIPDVILEDRKGNWITNGDWKVKPESLDAGQVGFGWRIPEEGGIFTEYSDKEHALRVAFSGKQPERCEVLSQYVPLRPAHRYNFRVKYEMSHIDSQSGLSWEILMPSGAVQGKGEMGGGLGALETSFSFAGPDTPAIGRLVLVYQRVLGTVRIEGELKIGRLEGSVVYSAE